AAGRHADDEAFGRVVGVVSLSAPANLDRMTDESKAKILAEGSIPLESSRTGQTLQIGVGWLQEQRDEPAAHDLLSVVAKIRPPVGVLHGADDPTVAAHDAVTIAQANPPRVQVHIVDGADHVFNTPNPFAIDAAPSRELAEVGEVMTAWIDSWIQ
ncbi:MAG: alpha/beta hydrolase, partial [Phycisphaerae bacterium]|nr:alpha/beta hydrolase [Phycisphaerae bacterium]